MDVDDGNGAADVAGEADAEKQDIDAQKAEHQPEHIEEEKEIADSTSTLPFRPTRSQSTDDAKASFRHQLEQKRSRAWKTHRHCPSAPVWEKSKGSIPCADTARAIFFDVLRGERMGEGGKDKQLFV
jgi:hypothetical protein